MRRLALPLSVCGALFAAVPALAADGPVRQFPRPSRSASTAAR
jgi:hypothetical protein